MKEQKVIITDSQNDVNSYLDKGWVVVYVTPIHAGSFPKWCFVIEKQKQ
jgi:hypothetical protein